MGNIIRNINAMSSVKEVKPEEEIIISDHRRPKRIQVKDFVISAGTALAQTAEIDIDRASGELTMELTLPPQTLIHDIYVTSAKQTTTLLNIYVNGVKTSTLATITIVKPGYGVTTVNHFPEGGQVSIDVDNALESTVGITVFYSKYTNISWHIYHIFQQ